MATQSTPNLINTITNASATSFGVAGGDSAAITVTNTAEAAKKCNGRWTMAQAAYSPPDIKIEA